MKGSDNYYIGNFKFKRGSQEILNEVIIRNSEKMLVDWANSYKENPKSFLNTFLKFNSQRMAACLIIFACRKNGILKELKGKKDFSEWVGKQRIEERWKPVLENLLLIIWGINK